MNFYNENDPQKAEWLRELIKSGIISKGIVDERSIEELRADELDQYTQCHFFAGIGIWSYALRLAGWPDSQRVWTGSCPCQPFSVAGERKGQMDQRHVWPAWFRLITQWRPGVVFGEQVADGDGIAWLDSVQTDMEAAHYRVGPCVLPAAGFGAPHGRHRLCFVADTNQERIRTSGSGGIKCEARETKGPEKEWERFRNDTGQCGTIGGLAHTRGTGWREGALTEGSQPASGERVAAIRSNAGQEAGRICVAGVALGDTYQEGPQGQSELLGTSTGERFIGQTGSSCDVAHAVGRIGDQSEPQPIFGPTEKPSAVNGFWSDAEWLWCKDQKYRAVEPGTFPLAHGAAARILRLRGYGDGIVAPQAAEFIKAYREITGTQA